MSECLVLPTGRGLLVQIVLLLCCLGAMVWKKVVDKSRTCLEFVLDSSKQAVAGLMIHSVNLVSSTFFGKHARGNADACEWYLIALVVDLTIGICLQFALLRASTAMVRRFFGAAAAEDCHSGEYWNNGQFRCRSYFKQLLIWLLIVCSVKTWLLLGMLLFAAPLSAASMFVLRPFEPHPGLKLIVVMILLPATVSAFQFWLTDDVIKKQGIARGAAAKNNAGEGHTQSRTHSSASL